MTKEEKVAYQQGQAVLSRRLLRELSLHLPSWDTAVAEKIREMRERADVVQKLRDLCREHGDNDWTDNQHLGDVIEKHLACYLQSRKC